MVFDYVKSIGAIVFLSPAIPRHAVSFDQSRIRRSYILEILIWYAFVYIRECCVVCAKAETSIGIVDILCDATFALECESYENVFVKAAVSSQYKHQSAFEQ